MEKRVKYDENFFVKYSKEIPLNFDLPLKLQKRQLLQILGFPVDNSLLIPIQDLLHIKITLSEWIKKASPFMIGIHLKPLSTYITPFFSIENRENIKYRDEFGETHILKLKQVFKKISEFSSQNWVEFIKPIWGLTTITGRMIYFSSIRQLMEIQKSVLPDEIGNRREKFPYFSVELQFFQVNSRKLMDLGGFEQTEINAVISSLKKYQKGFESLLRIADLPTIEFGYMMDRKLVVIDIDWPKQYQY